MGVDMFAAAVLVAQSIWSAAKAAALWIATKALVLYCLVFILPWVFRKFFVWGIDFFIKYGQEMASFVSTELGEMLQEAGMQTNINIELTGVGGYLAIQTGLVDYISIISTGWGLYWIVVLTLRRWRYTSPI